MEVCLLGTDFLSANRGCGALGYSTVEILSQLCREKNEELKIYGIVHAVGKLALPDDPHISVSLIKIEPKKLSFWKNIKKIFRSSKFVIDFTGGDSFSDMYGKKRFYLSSVIKQIALKSGTPFILGPQTIGPFYSWGARRFACHILRKCTYCWTRDRLSQSYTEKLCGRVPQLTTDVAFSLPTVQNVKIDSEKIKIGFNPSGLLWSQNRSFQADKHICVDYHGFVQQVLKKLTEDGRFEVFLIPHVFVKDSVGGENDLAACRQIHDMFPGTQILLDHDSPMEVKGIIAQMDLFIGARMHATIAAFSSGVATIPFSYSRKFEGLYQDLDYPYLISGEKMSTEDAVESTLSWIENRALLCQKVRQAHPRIQEKQKDFYDMIRKLCQ